MKVRTGSDSIFNFFLCSVVVIFVKGREGRASRGSRLIWPIRGCLGGKAEPQPPMATPAQNTPSIIHHITFLPLSCSVRKTTPTEFLFAFRRLPIAMGSRLYSPLSSWLNSQCPRCHTRLHRLHRLHRNASVRSFSTSIARPASVAAVISEPGTEQSDLPPNLLNARLVPASPSYFTRQPSFTDGLIKLRSLLRKHETMPTLSSTDIPRVAWRTTAQFRLVIGEQVSAAKYHKALQLLRRLNRIHPALRSGELQRTMEIYKSDIQPHDVQRRPQLVDSNGRASGVGRRKTSSAKVFLVQGSGEILVNGKSINSVFGRIHDRESAMWALKATQRLDKYNVWALVKGGGTTGQAEALTLGTAKALMVHEPALKPILRRGKLFYILLYLYRLSLHRTYPNFPPSFSLSQHIET